MPVQNVRVIPIAAPTEEERARPYLWRFWRHVPEAGRTVIFDRSWYGRVLVERVEGFTPEHDWRRAYGEINEFETMLDSSGIRWPANNHATALQGDDRTQTKAPGLALGRAFIPPAVAGDRFIRHRLPHRSVS